MSLKNNKYTLRNDLKTKRDQLENKDNFNEIIQKNLINYITNSRYPKMELWQEIIFLKSFFKGKFCVENVVSYYEYFIHPTAEIGRHYLWANFKIPKIELPKDEVGTMMKEYVGKKNHAHNKKLEDRNAVNSELGLHILNCANNSYKENNVEQIGLFKACL